ncbi:MAG: D-glycerate dehydrogenase [Candidatus Nitrosocaldaceae archaeon]|nr:MAG: D-glycerate dehydrogenase [Candidatus Nitrosocaldaceae archaeon]GIU71799.1 MAG: D-glycerate dehydrogenase [Candidatus Nitrosocaldaceae archaeon]
MKPRVYLTRYIPKAIELLEKEFEVIVHKDKIPPDHTQLIDNIKGVDALLCLPTDKIDKEVIDNAKNLKVISTYSVGYDHIDLDAAKKRGIIIGYTPDVLTDATADLTLALLLAIARRVVEGDRLIRSNKWSREYDYYFMLGRDLKDKILGIIGLGRIGLAVAKRAEAFGMKIIYYSKHKKDVNYEFTDLDDLLSKSDFTSLHVSLNKDTYHLINKDRLKAMKSTAYLINTARGKIVDEEALIRALKEHWIAGAALDVFEEEPLINSELINLDNVVLTPHIGSATIETREKMAEIAAMNIINTFKGSKPIYQLNL